MTNLSLVGLFRSKPKAFAFNGNEIVPGTEKPTIILARMLAAEMLQHLGARDRRNSWSGLDYEFPSFTLRTKYWVPGHPGFELVKEVIVSDGSNLTIKEAPELKIIQTAFFKFLELKKRQDEMRAEEARQHKAIDAIAKICKIDEGGDTK